jgi:lipid-A-disaccharide synthase
LCAALNAASFADVSAPARGIRIGIVAGEISGDTLASRLMRALKTRLPDVGFEGIGGTQMQAEGCVSLYPMERLSVLGVTEILGRFRELKRIRDRLVEHFRHHPPHVFIGVDSPGFNLGLEEALRSAGIRTAHFVSPQVWAWRTWRVHQIRRAVDRMLVLFPFEAEFYARHGVPATFVGHPLADEISGDSDPRDCRARLRLAADAPTVALLPGSRAGELRTLADLMVQAARWLRERHPRLQFVSPFVSAATREMFEAALTRQGATDLPIMCVEGRSREAIGAADVVLCASGTATLETMLIGRPMVVTYRVSWLSSWLVRLFSHLEHYAMPNHLAGRRLVPELLQRDAVPEKLGAAVEHYLTHPQDARTVVAEFRRIAATLRVNAAQRAADEILKLLPDVSVNRV